MKKKLVIIGGTGDFGSFIANFLKNNFPNNLEIFISGTKKDSLEKISSKLGIGYFDDNIEAVKTCDIIVFSVPINRTIEIIKDLGPHIKPGSVVLDVTSIKKLPSEALENYIPKSCLFIPTHPMFGPGIKNISGQIVVLTPPEETKNDSRYIFLKNTLEKLGAKVIETTPEDHDKMMAVVQGLTHYSMFVIGKTIKKYGVDVLKTLDFVSPIYKLMIASVSRYIGQGPELYADIQMNNDEILKIHDMFTKTSSEFNNIVKEKNREEFVSMVLETREFFGKENCDFGQKYTDKIIYLMGRENSKLKENIGKSINLENIYSKSTLSGILKNVDDHNIYLDDQVLDINEWVIF